MANTDVQEMVNLCKGLGLRVAFETGSAHYTVRDPDSDAKLFYISSTPSDSNFKYEIARHLRRLGLLKGNLKFGKFKTIKRKKRYGPIDMVALRKAQAQAESAGERIPLLEDIDGDHTFLRQTASRLPAGYTTEAQQEAIDTMAIKATPRSNATKQRLRKTLEEKKMTNTEFVKIAMEVAEERDLRGWKTLNQGQAAIGKFRNEDGSTMQIWGINLVEATLDKIDGLKWGIDESRRKDSEPQPEPEPTASDDAEELVSELTAHFVTEETLGNILDNFRVQIENLITEKMSGFVAVPVEVTDNWRDKYAEVLLARLADTESTDDPEIYMSRLDKLVG